MAVEAHGGRKAGGGRQAQGVTEVTVGSHGYVGGSTGGYDCKGREGGGVKQST